MKSTRVVQAATDGKQAAAKSEKYEIVDLGPFDHNRNDVLAINDPGQCAGVSQNNDTGRIEAFRQERGIRTMLGTLGGSFSIARALNNHGDVVGGSLTEGDEKFHGFIYQGHRLRDLNDLLNPEVEWEVLQALAINNYGEIVAIGCHDGEDRIVLLRPAIGKPVGSHP
jgi:probable HAF family extracellular repeat protein